MTPGDLAADPDRYDGKHVIVRGFVAIGPHERDIFDSKKGYEQAGATCLGLLGTSRLRVILESKWKQ
jgi:hypothetical protein